MSQQINLFNPIFLQQKKIFAARKMAQALGVLALGGCIIAGTAWYSVGKLRREVAEVTLQAAKNQARLIAAASEFAPRKPNDGLTLEAGDAEAQLASLRRVAQIIQKGDLGDTRGYAETFRALGRQHQDGLWLTGLTIAGAEMSLQGRALDAALVPAYMVRLTHEPVLQGKSFGNLQITQPPATALAVTPAAPLAASAPQKLGLPPELAALVPQLAGATPPAPVVQPVVVPAPVPLAFVEFSLQAKAVETRAEDKP